MAPPSVAEDGLSAPAISKPGRLRRGKGPDQSVPPRVRGILGHQLADGHRPGGLDPGLELLERAHHRVGGDQIDRVRPDGVRRQLIGGRALGRDLRLEAAGVRLERRQGALVGERPGEVERGDAEAVEHLRALTQAIKHDVEGRALRRCRHALLMGLDDPGARSRGEPGHAANDRRGRRQGRGDPQDARPRWARRATAEGLTDCMGLTSLRFER